MGREKYRAQPMNRKLSERECEEEKRMKKECSQRD